MIHYKDGTSIRFVLQAQINEPGYSQCGVWFDFFDRKTLEEARVLRKEQEAYQYPHHQWRIVSRVITQVSEIIE
jgi:hypothetical protein